MVILLAYGAGVALCTYLAIKVIGKGKPKPGAKRRMSFNSQAMLDMPFPPTCGVPPPVINSLLLFAKCPPQELIEEHCKYVICYRYSDVNEVFLFEQVLI
jgi:hypothetical protein